MAWTGVPYALAPVIDNRGCLLDGHSFSEAAHSIDETVSPRPLYYLAGCVHPSTFLSAVEEGGDRMRLQIPERLAGLKANASPLPPEQLDSLDHVDGDAPAILARDVLAVRRRYQLRIVGGCCGTSDRHIRALAEGLSSDHCAGAGR
jgi:methionine synthase I (cobalamin-dependent)